MGEKPPGLRCQQIKLWAPRRQVGAVKQDTDVTLPCGRSVQTCIFAGDKDFLPSGSPSASIFSSKSLNVFKYPD